MLNAAIPMPASKPAYGLVHKLGLTWEFARSSFLIMLAHRVRYMVGVANYMTYVAVNYYLWEALYADVPPGGKRGDFTLREMSTYVSVGWIMRSAYFSNADNVLAARINKGEINSDLLRPVSLFLQFYGAALGEAVFRAFFMALTSSFLVRKGLGNDWIAFALPHILWFNTAVLLASSATIHVARRQLREGAEAAFNRWWAVTTALGLMFLVGQLAA